MKSAVIVFPGSNRERDMLYALEKTTGHKAIAVWHQETSLPDVDLIVLPGGFSFGDYLRTGAIAGLSPIMNAVKEKAAQGVRVLGVCNGFQILAETGLLPGILLRNAHLKFVCKEVKLEVASAASDFTSRYTRGQIIRCPVAHHDGNYFADDATLEQLEAEDRIAFRYTAETNPNGSIRNIAGILNEKRNVLGMMPHPENLIEPAQGGTDGRGIFESVLEAIA
ncbi:MAG: phosphoribosylformylglycinamidine synthase subunit PurQ [Alphaproteobacteria bacterium]|nr:phosphoribosylformylglycinamidine synthase I [Rhodobiaceae bacterium]MBO6543393.1 phosphoribosylformylglycinamidine synthase subunit PurQ [Alphaproteobacteria bacterium]MBO6627535.1 phosphoribosylformylglycinamidine synthase subunit PurQ [Alphaproteobacteria bacterium]MDF1627178.1 phosphoribosylformylglycinamidine synthase subunit PurQ [Parvibaculaceae bacterium]